jgi:hypothetical protein
MLVRRIVSALLSPVLAADTSLISLLPKPSHFAEVQQLKIQSPVLIGLLFAMTAVFIVGCGPPRLKASPNSTLPPTVMMPISTVEQEDEANRPLDPRIADMHVDGAHVFQDYLDPEVADSRPDDFTIYSGWTEYLMNDSVRLEEASTTWHLCWNGMVLNDSVGDQTERDWRIARSLGTPEDDWGTVSVMVEITTGRWKGHEYAALTLTRKDGNLFASNTTTPGPVEIERSERCPADAA